MWGNWPMENFVKNSARQLNHYEDHYVNFMGHELSEVEAVFLHLIQSLASHYSGVSFTTSSSWRNTRKEWNQGYQMDVVLNVAGVRESQIQFEMTSDAEPPVKMKHARKFKLHNVYEMFKISAVQEQNCMRF